MHPSWASVLKWDLNSSIICWKVLYLRVKSVFKHLDGSKLGTSFVIFLIDLKKFMFKGQYSQWYIMLSHFSVQISTSILEHVSLLTLWHTLSRFWSPSHHVSGVDIPLPLSVSTTSSQSVSPSVSCHRASPVMAVPMNVFLCRLALLRHRRYTTLLMALSGGLFTEPVRKTALLSVLVFLSVCVFVDVFRFQLQHSTCLCLS